MPTIAKRQRKKNQISSTDTACSSSAIDDIPKPISPYARTKSALPKKTNQHKLCHANGDASSFLVRDTPTGPAPPPKTPPAFTQREICPEENSAH